MESHTRATLAHHKSDGSPAGTDALGCCLGICSRDREKERQRERARAILVGFIYGLILDIYA